VLYGAGAQSAIRWTPGERLQHLFEARCDTLARQGQEQRLAVDGEVPLTFAELDRAANRLARHLRARGLCAGDRIGLLFNRSYHSYVALLGVLKINAAYVPLDIAFPAERIAFIAADADLRCILTLRALAGGLDGLAVERLCLDNRAAAIATQDDARLPAAAEASPDALCYVIYTSGSTGRPKGVPISHASICNFVRVAAATYGYRPGDRVYQARPSPSTSRSRRSGCHCSPARPWSPTRPAPAC
jgi:non-ribosomal peptide synthetase component F